MTTSKKFTFNLTRKTGKNNTLPKGNQILNSNDRMHHYVKGQITSYLRELGYAVVTEQEGILWEPMYTVNKPCQILVTIHPPSKRRIDPPNLYPTIKALIDGMTDAHMWDDDDSDTIKMMSFTKGKITSNKQYKISIEVTGYTE